MDRIKSFIKIIIRKTKTFLQIIKNKREVISREQSIKKHQNKLTKIQLKNFAIISANCWAGSVYEDLKLQYQTPTIGLFFYAPCYIEFLKKLKYYLSCELKFIEKSNYPDANKYRNENYLYPIGVLDNKVEIHFLHYKTEQEASDKWNRRKKRFDFDNLFIAMTDRDHCTYELMQEFDNLPYNKKVIFTTKKYKDIKSSVYLSAYKKRSVVGDLYNQRENVTIDFNLKKWLEK